MTGICDICKGEFDYIDRLIGGFVCPTSSRIRIDLCLGGKLEIHECKVCERCATRVINYVNNLQATEGTRF